MVEIVTPYQITPAAASTIRQMRTSLASRPRSWDWGGASVIALVSLSWHNRASATHSLLAPGATLDAKDRDPRGPDFNWPNGEMKPVATATFCSLLAV